MTNCTKRCRSFRFSLATILLLSVSWNSVLLRFVLVSASKEPDSPNIGSDGNGEDLNAEPWQTCQSFLAPSPTSPMGWSVFAGRSFRKGEIVEIAPGMVPMNQDSLAISTTALDDYVYGYFRLRDLQGQQITRDSYADMVQHMYAVMFGMGMIFNHHPTPNLEYNTFGREPAPEVPTAANAIGFIATRDIAEGEELLSTYGKEDGGKDWFRRRKIPMEAPVSSRIPVSELSTFKDQYCSKISAGLGQPTWKRRFLPILPPQEYLPFWMDPKWLPPFDAEIGTARAKQQILRGDRIELGTSLIMSKSSLKGTPLAPLAISWQDLALQDQDFLREARSQGQWMLQFNDWTSASEWHRKDGFTSFEDVALLPIGGSVGLVERVGNDSSANCHCRLTLLKANDETSSHDQASNVVVAIELIATQDIPVGEILRVSLPSTLTKYPKELALLQEELRRTGRVPSSGPFAAEATSKRAAASTSEL